MDAGRAMQRILLADDDPDSLESLCTLLTAWGYEVGTAPNGRAALDKVSEFRPSVVITDVVMPALDGLGFLEAVKREEPDLPVIVMTGRGSLDIHHHAVAGGAFGYLCKPVDTARLKSLLASAIADGGARPG
jgi:DNA-binding NtrC family response regulator